MNKEKIAAVNLSGWEVVPLKYRVKEKYLPLVQTVLVQEKTSFVLSGISAAESNAIRRVISAELPIKHLVASYADITTNDVFIIPEMIQARLICLPIMQDTPMDARYNFYADNSGAVAQILDAQAGLLRSADGEVARTAPNITLFDLRAGCTCEIKNIRVAVSSGVEKSRGQCCIASGVSSTVVGTEPLSYDKESGNSFSNCNPTQWKISFVTNGTRGSADIVRAACTQIIGRVRKVAAALSVLTLENGLHSGVVSGETYTISTLFLRAIADHRSMATASIRVDDLQNSFQIRINCKTDPAVLIRECETGIVSKFEEIKNQIPSE